jgi:hypothetical protein
MCCGMLASCAVSCCSACACKVCCRFGNAQSTGVKLLYAFLLLFTSLLSLAMLGTGMQSWLNEQLSSFWFTGPAEGELMRDELVGTLAVTRIMTATVVFHLLLAPLVCGISNTKNPRAALHNGLWPAKILGLIGLIVLMFFLPNELFVGLSSTLYRVGGGLYILIQLILFLGCVYNFYEYIFINKGETQGWMCVVVVLTLLAYLWVGFVVVATIVIHSGGDGCAEGLVGGLVGLLACIVVSALSVSGCVPIGVACRLIPSCSPFHAVFRLRVPTGSLPEFFLWPFPLFGWLCTRGVCAADLYEMPRTTTRPRPQASSRLRWSRRTVPTSCSPRLSTTLRHAAVLSMMPTIQRCGSSAACLCLQRYELPPFLPPPPPPPLPAFTALQFE